MQTTSLTLPIIHNNGTGADTLFDGYLAARSALRDAEEALKKVEFNSRDYYPVAGSWEKALEERRWMFVSLTKMQADCLAICAHIQANRRK